MTHDKENGVCIDAASVVMDADVAANSSINQKCIITCIRNLLQAIGGHGVGLSIN